MKRLPPVLLSVTLAALALAVGGVLGFIAAGVVEFAYGRFNPNYFWKYDDPAEQWHYEVYPEVGAIVGAVAGVILGLWLTCRLFAARSCALRRR